MKRWTFSHEELIEIGAAIGTWKDTIDNIEDGDLEEHYQICDTIAEKLQQMRQAIRREWLEQEGASPYTFLDEAAITIRERGGLPYKVVNWGGGKWAVVSQDDPTRPVAEKLYDHQTHAHRRKRELIRVARLEEITHEELHQYYECDMH